MEQENQKPLTFGNAIGEAWRLTTKNFWKLFLISLITGIVVYAWNFVCGLFISDTNLLIPFYKQNLSNIPIWLCLLSIRLSVTGLVALGFIKVTLKVLDDEPISALDLFSQWKKVWTYLVFVIPSFVGFTFLADISAKALGVSQGLIGVLRAYNWMKYMPNDYRTMEFLEKLGIPKALETLKGFGPLNLILGFIAILVLIAIFSCILNLYNRLIVDKQRSPVKALNRFCEMIRSGTFFKYILYSFGIITISFFIAALISFSGCMCFIYGVAEMAGAFAKVGFPTLGYAWGTLGIILFSLLGIALVVFISWVEVIATTFVYRKLQEENPTV